jgi:hypothetical protein
MNADMFGRARAIRESVAGHPGAIEYLARAALLLHDIETVDGKCPLCGGQRREDGKFHSWQCDVGQALDMLDGMAGVPLP